MLHLNLFFVAFVVLLTFVNFSFYLKNIRSPPPKRDSEAYTLTNTKLSKHQMDYWIEFYQSIDIVLIDYMFSEKISFCFGGLGGGGCKGYWKKIVKNGDARGDLTNL